MQLQGGRCLPYRRDAPQLLFESADSEASKFADLKSQIDPRDKLRKSIYVAYHPEIIRFSGKSLSFHVLPCTATSRGGFGVHSGVTAVGLGQYPVGERLNANLERIADTFAVYPRRK